MTERPEENPIDKLARQLEDITGQPPARITLTEMKVAFDEYPLYLYRYDDDGYHNGYTVIHDEEELNAFFTGAFTQDLIKSREVRITDTGDHMVFWMKHQAILHDGLKLTRKESRDDG